MATVKAARKNVVTGEIEFYTYQQREDEITAHQEREAERTKLFSAAGVLDPLPSPYSQSELNAKVEGLISLLRMVHPELVRRAISQLGGGR